MNKFLIIEDEEDIRENIKEIFELTGNKVYGAINGEEGIKMVSKIKPDLILCDINMPGLDGFEVKKILAKKKQTSCIPFIFLTADANLISIREGMNLGADDYIVKPVKAKELLDAVTKRINRITELKSTNIDDTNEKKLDQEDKIPINTGKEHLFVPINNIVVINVKEDYTMVFINDGRKFLIRKTIKSWENILPEKIFIRAHRNIIVNLNYIEKIEPWFNGALVAKLRNYSESIKFSKRYSQIIKRMLKSKE